MIIACPRCAASYAVDAAAFGPRNRVVQCSACDHRWSQCPPEGCEADAKEPPVASPDGDPLEPIREAQSMELEAPVPEAASPVAVEKAPNAPAPAPPAVSAAESSLLENQVRYALQEQTSALPAENAGEEEAETPSNDAAKAQPLDLRSRRFAVAGIAAAGTVITLVAVLILLREPIVSTLPDATGIYGLIGLAPDPLGNGLEIREVASTRERLDGEDVLSVTGIVANVSRQREPLPALRVSLYDPADKELQAVTVPQTQESIDAGETVRFQTTIPGSRPEARRLRVGFAPP